MKKNISKIMKINIARKITTAKSADEIITLLLKDRKIDDIDSFLNPTHPSEIHFEHFFADVKNNDQKFKSDWKKVIKELEKIKKEKKMIVVYMDYDADGITGGAIVWQMLNALDFKVMPYVPDRKKEGYGFSKQGLDMVKQKYDPALIISVDHGIVAHEQIAYADQLGMKIVVTDHHQKKPTLPEKAFAIFHTDKVSGSGVAYFFAKEVAKTFPHEFTNNKYKALQERFAKDFLALAAIGIIADVVPLTGEARSVAYHGLSILSKPAQLAQTSPGLSALLQEVGVWNKPITTYEVGFMIAPRINAFGRIKSAMDALRLLCTNDPTKAKKLSVAASLTNKERQDLVEQAIEETEALVDVNKKILIVFSQQWEEGIIGLVAGKLLQQYNKPAIAITRSDGYAKASARSIPGIDITKFLRDLESYFIDLGGHEAAAGFSIAVENIEPFIQAAYKKADKEITADMLEKVIDVDMELPMETITFSLAKKLQALEPFGIGNRTPLFQTSAYVQDVIFMGQLKQHARLLLKNTNTDQTMQKFIEAVYFNGAEEAKMLEGKKVTLLCNIAVEQWQSKESLKVRVIRVV